MLQKQQQRYVLFSKIILLKSRYGIAGLQNLQKNNFNLEYDESNGRLKKFKFDKLKTLLKNSTQSNMAKKLKVDQLTVAWKN